MAIRNLPRGHGWAFIALLVGNLALAGGPFLVRHGYRWLTARLDPTISIFSWDHIFVRHLSRARPASAGVVRQVHGASDHRPVWAVVVPEGRDSGGVAKVPFGR